MPEMMKLFVTPSGSMGNWTPGSEPVTKCFHDGKWHKITHFSSYCECQFWGVRLSYKDGRCKFELDTNNPANRRGCSCGCENGSVRDFIGEYIILPPGKKDYNELYWSYVHAETEQAAYDGLKNLLEAVNLEMQPGDGSWCTSPDPAEAGKLLPADRKILSPARTFIISFFVSSVFLVLMLGLRFLVSM